jgi:hypothetical protein
MKESLEGKEGVRFFAGIAGKKHVLPHTED